MSYDVRWIFACPGMKGQHLYIHFTGNEYATS